MWRDDHKFRILKWIFRFNWALPKIMCLGIRNEVLFFLLGCLELPYDFIWSYHRMIDARVCNRIFLDPILHSYRSQTSWFAQCKVVLNRLFWKNSSTISAQIWFARDKHVFGIVKWLSFIISIHVIITNIPYFIHMSFSHPLLYFDFECIGDVFEYSLNFIIWKSFHSI